jgi:WD40 repeat protein
MQVWDASTRNTNGTRSTPALIYQSHKDYKGNGIPVHSVAWSHDGKWLAFGTDNGTVQVKQLTLVSDDGTMQSWDASPGNRFIYNSYQGGILSVAWSPDGKRLASASENGPVQVWEG